MERRQHRRVHTQLKSWLCADSHEAEGKTVDLSIGGAKFESPLTAKPGKQVTVKLVVPGVAVPIDIECAEIRWIRDRTFGVKFLEIRRSQADELERLIDEYLAVDEPPETNG